VKKEDPMDELRQKMEELKKDKKEDIPRPRKDVGTM
jgi:hypothetical protein